MSRSDGVSEAHRRYLAQRRRRQLAIFATQVLLAAVLLVLWEAGARERWVNPFIVSQPTRIWEQIVRMAAAGELWVHLGATVWRTMAGFGLATGLGLLVASLLWWSPFWARVVDPYLVVLNSVPKISLGPLFIVWLGTNVRAVLAMAVAIAVVVTIVMLYTAFRETDPNKILLLRSFGATRWQVFTKVVLPGAVPTLLAAVKVNIGLAWVGTIMGEFLVSGAGLGYLIIYGGQVFNLTLVMSSIVLLLIASTIVYLLVDWTEKYIARQRGRA
ncbi:MAG: sulfonate ABC transporter permease [Firmicutes bacterium ZCTH02-B6]|nr:MAG: sulfonate ABC transporter permease [Firmicutes bacterium ZCTH02-B6]